MSAVCPYCNVQNGYDQVIDQCHITLKDMKKKANTQNIYVCSYCGEIFKTRARNIDLTQPVDAYFDRPGAYSKKKFYEACNWIDEKSYQDHIHEITIQSKKNMDQMREEESYRKDW